MSEIFIHFTYIIKERKIKNHDLSNIDVFPITYHKCNKIYGNSFFDLNSVDRDIAYYMWGGLKFESEHPTYLPLKNKFLIIEILGKKKYFWKFDT